jgi:structural maintenance of chromosomes protein 5
MDRSGTVQAEALTTTGTYIREVILENFMSHEYSRIRLKRGVNIITGPNGSGKSSILLGIAVALGQTYTERAEKLSDLIQRGKDTARVTVIFDNSLINDKRPVRSITSDTIAITRYIKKSGEYWHYVNNRFRTKAEVDQLLKNIGINPNNMLIIMHQNMIENFASRNNIEKLQMVEDAVGISLLRERIVEAEARLRILMSETNNIKKLLSEAEASVEYWRSELEKLTKIRQLESTRKKLEQEYAWCLVKRIEDDLERKTKIREKLYGENEQLRIEIENLIREMLEKKEKIKTESRNEYPPVISCDLLMN